MKPETQKALLAAAGRYIRKLFGEVEPRIKAIEDRQAELPELVARAVEALPRPQDGKSIMLSDVEPMLRGMVAALPPAKDGEDGKSVTVDDVRPLVEDAVSAAVAGLPTPLDGKSVELADVLPLVADAVAKHFESNPVSNGADADPAEVARQVAEAVAALPAPQDGKDGPSADEVREMVAAAVAAIPKPLDGKSVSIDDVIAAITPRLEDRIEATLAKAVLDFERRAQGVLERAIAGIPKPKDGRDGLDLRHFTAKQVEDRTVTLTLSDGDRTEHVHLTFPVVIDRGVYSDSGKPGGGLYEKGDGVTFGGSFWIAQVDGPEGAPGVSKDWRLAVKKGRDGKSVVKLPGKEAPTTVRLPGAKPAAASDEGGDEGQAA
jgi:hypothetical protein